MEPDFSEFSFGFAITRELTEWSGPPFNAVPYFPSTVEEGSGSGGFDVKLDLSGVPLFLQFKLSHFMTRDTAREIKTFQCFPPGSQFYRMYIRPRSHSDQHQLLLNLESKGNLVYYVAPAFHLLSELNNAYSTSRVCTRSVWPRPSLIGPIRDNRKHHLSFQFPGPLFFLSKPREIDGDVSFAALRERIGKELKVKRDYTLREVLSPIPGQMIEILKQREPKRAPRTVRERFKLNLEMIDRIRKEMKLEQSLVYMARTLFDCEILFVSRKN